MKKLSLVIIVVGLVVALASLSFSAISKDVLSSKKPVTQKDLKEAALIAEKMEQYKAEQAKMAAEEARALDRDMLTAKGSRAVTTGMAPSVIARFGDVEVEEYVKEKKPSVNIAPPPDPNVILQGGDDCATATPIPSLPYYDTGTTCGFTDDYDEECPSSSTSPDVVYSYTPEVDTCIEISLCNENTDYDTKLFVYENECVSPYYACNDDAFDLCPLDNYWSVIADLPVTGGNTYYIVVDGWGGGCGNYDLSVIGVECYVPQPGDNCDSPLTVSLPGDLPYLDAGQTTCGRVNDYDETCLGSYDGGEDIIYEVTVTSDVTVDVSVTSDASWVGLAIDEECPPGFSDEICIATSSSSSGNQTITGIALTTGTYYIMVDTWPSPNCIESFDLSITESSPAPANDDCEDAEAITGPYPATGTGTTIGATVDCPGVLDWNGVWYTIDLPYESNDINIVMCGEGEDLWTVGIVLMDDCACDDYIIRDSGEFIDCPNGYGGYDMTFLAVPGGPRAVIYWPAYAENQAGQGMNFSYTVNVTEAGVCDVTCPDGGIPENEPPCGDEYVDNYNGGCNSTPPVFQPINPGDIMCAESGTYLFEGSNYRDTDWFEWVNTDGTMELTWRAVAEFPLATFIIDGTNGCDNLVILTSGTGNPCDTVEISAIVGPGTYWMFAAPSVFSGWDCVLEYVGWFTAEPYVCTPDLVVDPLVIPYTHNGATCGYGNDFSETCLGSYDGGEDFMYEFNVTSSGWYEFTLDPYTTTYTGFLLDDMCPPDPSVCIAISTSSSATPHGFNTYLDAGTYYVMVDTWPTPDCIPEYDLSIVAGSEPPEGDWCGNPYIIPSLPYTDEDNSCNYTNQCDIEGSDGSDVIYEMEMTELMYVTVSLCGSSYDTKIAVFADECCSGPGTEFMYNDDYCGTQSQVEGNFPPGTYYIVVDGFGSACGDYILNITEEEPCNVECPPEGILEGEPPCGPEYDDTYNGGCNSETPVFQPITPGDVICGESGTFLFGGSNYRDTDWFEWVCDETGPYSFTAVGEFPILIFFIDGTGGCDNLVIMASATADPCDTASLTQTLTAGNTYWLWVGPSVFDGWPCVLEYVASFQPVATPAFSVDPTSLEGNAPPGGSDTGVISVSNVGEAGSVLTFSANCTIDNPILRTSEPVGPATGGQAPNWTIGEGSNSPDAKFANTPEDKAPYTGEPNVPDPNIILQGGDDCANATVVTGLPYTDDGTIVGYTDDYEEVCPYSSTSPDVVYVFTPTEDIPIDITLCLGTTDYDTKLFVYEDVCESPYYACNDDACADPFLFDSELIGMVCYAGHDYYIIVDGYGGDAGNYTIEITEGEMPPPPPQCPEGSMFSQSPNLPDADYWSFHTSDIGTDPDYLCYENFWDLTAPIEGIGFWGVDLGLPPWSECFEDPAVFEVIFYEDDAGLPGAVVATYTTSITPVPTGLLYAGVYEMNWYSGPINPPLDFAAGWVSIQGISDPQDCVFLWASSYDGDALAYQWDGSALVQLLDDNSNGLDLSLCILPSFQLPWLSIDISTGSIPYGDPPIDITATMDATDLEEGTYTGSINFTTNDPNNPNPTVPVTFVVGEVGCDYVPGDANGDGSPAGNDVTYSVRYFKGLGDPPPDSCPYQGGWLYSAGDANGSCSYSGSDVTFLVAYFKGQNPEILYCPETPPAGGGGPTAIIRGNKAVVPKNQ